MIVLSARRDSDGARANAACRGDLLTPSSKQLCFAVDGELPSAANEAPIPAPLRAQMLAREQAIALVPYCI